MSSEVIAGPLPLETPEHIGALTVEQFCKTYGVGRTHFYDEVKAGRIEAKKSGKKTLILRAEAARWARELPKLERTEAGRC